VLSWVTDAAPVSVGGVGEPSVMVEVAEGSIFCA
jgi:hypothetical protein